MAHWDNSVNNLLNPDPSKSVPFGLQSWEEMLVGGVDYIFERPEEAAQHAKTHADKFFDIFDANSDDYLTPNEIPALRPTVPSGRHQDRENIAD